MKKTLLLSLVLGLPMVAASGVATMMTPRDFLARSRPAIDLASAIPAQFGDWKEDRNLVAAVVNPQLQATVEKTYAQTLSRTYINRRGERIMLSIAYSENQSDGVETHYPEVCYPAQGFQVDADSMGEIATPQGGIPVKRLQTNQAGRRYEPVTYWTTVGDTAVTRGMDKKLAQMRYGMRGVIPDGLLFRVSSINRDAPAAFTQQETFTRELVLALPPALRQRIAGLRG